MDIASSVNIAQLAFSTFESYGKDISLYPQFQERLLDFICVLKFRRSHKDLLATGDAGIIKVIQLFGMSAITDQSIQQRYVAAAMQGDQKFLNRVENALKLQRKIDGRIKGGNLFLKAFLFLNWHEPFLFVDTPVKLWSNQQILDRLAEIFASTAESLEWDEARLKKEIHVLGLSRI